MSEKGKGKDMSALKEDSDAVVDPGPSSSTLPSTSTSLPSESEATTESVFFLLYEKVEELLIGFAHLDLDDERRAQKEKAFRDSIAFFEDDHPAGELLEYVDIFLGCLRTIKVSLVNVGADGKAELDVEVDAIANALSHYILKTSEFSRRYDTPHSEVVEKAFIQRSIRKMESMHNDIRANKDAAKIVEIIDTINATQPDVDDTTLNRTLDEEGNRKPGLRETLEKFKNVWATLQQDIKEYRDRQASTSNAESDIQDINDLSSNSRAES